MARTIVGSARVAGTLLDVAAALGLAGALMLTSARDRSSWIPVRQIFARW